MSIIIGHLSRREIVIATDTLGVDDPNNPSITVECGKSMTLPHHQAVVACRGTSAWYVVMTQRLSALCGKAGSFDDLARRFPEIVGDTYERVVPLVESMSGGYACQVMLAGWSDADKRAKAVVLANVPADLPMSQFASVPDSPDFHQVEVPDGYFLIPGLSANDASDHQRKHVKSSTFDWVVAAAKAVRTSEARQGNKGIGGRLIVTRLNQWSIEQKTPFVWPDADQIGDWPNDGEAGEEEHDA